ncbi:MULTISPECIES: carbohydrate ABC transporter permease [unclassified Fusibacter]|uniref:carbohydrate ABC transporter permease n=1 Tax=unclassified Fusibacter TaxID=2624464 RepID=UPI001010E670|nr:sugar ABC transporter permease [Fusibacter sp. A1]MCK8060080.1 sugar ABC transporter permease [Fusibacter sp. A2]NPE22222.1 sugar ABC transporter permease [Fusibacter sp. A1]RXV60996.1 sugar ABC transporter permease [Fusibacter sp. A1]
MKKYFGNRWAVALFTMPALILFTVMVFYPIVQVFYRSFYDWNGLSSGIFIGFDNFIRLFDDKVFKIANLNGFKFALVITMFQLTMATVLALAVSTIKFKGKNFFRIVYFIPVVLSVTVVCQLWLSIYNADTGLLNRFFEAVGLDFRQNWLVDRHNAIYAIAIVNAWQWMGYQFALILAGIKSIPTSYYEAARIDGAGVVKAHLKITIPLLAETFKFCLVISVTGGIKAFTEMFIMSGGGPGNSTYTLTYMMYSSAFRSGEFGYGLAAAAVLVLECLMAILVINWIFKTEKAVEGA